MKKVLFTTMSIIAVAAMMLVSCKKDDTKKNETPDDPTPAATGSDWTVIGSINGDSWTVDIDMVQNGDIFAAKGVTLAAGDEFKIRYQKAWDANRGGTFVALGKPFAVENNGANIKPGLEGTYDIYYNSAEELMEITEANATPDWTLAPAAPAWDYVMNISSYKTNSEFHFANPVKVNPGAMTFQWKFYATEWNDYDQVIERDGESYKVWANRLGQICNSGEKGILLRFNDGHNKGSLRLNAAIFANDGKDYVQKDGADYIWSLNEWHTLSIVADGSNVTVYDNAEAVYTFEYSVPEVYTEWPVERFDISMTWDDGTRYDKGQAFRGYIAYTRLWTRALSAEQVAGSLCDVEDNTGLALCWNWNADEGATIANAGSAAGYDLDFTTALAGGQQSYVKAEDIAATWTDVTEVEGLAPVCPAAE